MNKSLHELYPELPTSGTLPPRPLEQFEEVRRGLGKSYRPRTRHLQPDGSATFTNRLFLESSPYLLQHAHNPVNWFPWGEEAFRLAAELDRPLLVSIGYATCHWCHVMEEESFEDLEIARFLNDHFIAVKVDREERPDLDSVYMASLHATGAQGGWPLNVFLTPDRKPFYGGTYFPPFDHSRGIGFLSLLKRLSEAYRNSPQRVAQAGERLAEAVKEILSASRGAEVLPQHSLESAVRSYREGFDPVNGGLSGAPKFPSSLPIPLLLRAYRHQKDQELLQMARLSLRKMANGGIYDQVGGGFHRYATDAKWEIPHFEKMLYDNALLAVAYLEGYQLLRDPELATVVREVLRYLEREMASPEGAFYSATDADSLAPDGKLQEGFFFTWTPEELRGVLGRERSGLVEEYLAVTDSGNFEGRNVLHRAGGIEEVALERGLPAEQGGEILEESREMLYRARESRPHPFRDEKVLSSWNGLAISAFARGALLLDLPGAIGQARATAGFILEKMMKEGRLSHSYQRDEAKGEGFLDDYAFFIGGLIDLFEVTGEALWLERSLELTAVVQREFEDQAQGGFFMTGSRHEELIAREKPAYDGVVPSGNSAMILNLLRLNALTEDGRYLEAARKGVRAFGRQLESAPTALSDMLLALDFLEDTPVEVAIVAPAGRRDAAAGLVDAFRAVFLPNRALVVTCEGEELERAEGFVPFLRGKKGDGDRAVAYLCENRSCRLPTSDPEEFLRQLREVSR